MSEDSTGRLEKTIGANGKVRPAHPIITREVQTQAVQWHPHGYEGFYEIADAAAIAIEETIRRERAVARPTGGRHWSQIDEVQSGGGGA